jgi:hypothetical protein
VLIIHFSHGEAFIIWILMAILVNNCLKKINLSQIFLVYMEIGFIGTGLMGFPMAKNLLKHKLNVKCI